MKELICIVCPKGCHLRVDEENGYAVTGNSCEKGAAYGKKELTNPIRVVTSTVRVEGGKRRRVSVKTSRDIPKSRIFEAMALLNNLYNTTGGMSPTERKLVENSKVLDYFDEVMEDWLYTTDSLRKLNELVK